VSENFPAVAGARPAGFTPGARIAGYILEEQIGAGGMAVVFRARDERLQRRVALKILSPALAPDDAFRQRFIRESQAAAAVDDPHIIPVFGAGEAEGAQFEGAQFTGAQFTGAQFTGALYIAMRYVPGGDVRALLRRARPLTPERALAIVSPVASALDAAHGAGLVHRDVKPENMLLDTRPGRPDHVYLSDFGLSKGVMASLGPTGTGQWLGTAGYSSPEQMAGKPVDGRADQYSLACVAFELLCGEVPFPREHVTAVIWAHMSEPPPTLTSRMPAFPAGADGVLARALAKSPGDRFASCRDFADALRAAFALVPYNSGSGHAVEPRPSRLETEISVPVSYHTPDVPMSHAVTQPSSAVPPPAPAPATVAPAAARPPAAGRRRGSRWVALAAAVAALGTAIGLVVTHPQHHRAPAHTATAPLTASYAFPAEQYGNGLTVTRRWLLSGKQGSRLTETVIVANPAGKAVAVWFKDSIPEAATSNIKAISFHPAPVKVLRADPVVEWYLRLPAHGTVTVGYVAVVAPGGATTARLTSWANGLDAIEKELNIPAKKHPRPRATPTYTYTPPAPTPTSTTSSGGNGGPAPYPTYTCDPQLITCTTGGGGGGNGGF
jgi:serine/threonine protein kinase